MKEEKKNNKEIAIRLAVEIMKPFPINNYSCCCSYTTLSPEEAQEQKLKDFEEDMESLRKNLIGTARCIEEYLNEE